MAADQLDAIETVMDFHVLEKSIDQLLARVHNRHLNDVEPFIKTKVNPTAERVAWWIATEIARGLPAGIRMVSVRVGEAPGCSAMYKP